MAALTIWYCRLFNNPAHSDIVVAAGSFAFDAHRAILGLRTSFFTNATNPSSGFSEAEQNVVRIEEHSCHAVWRFLIYCYTGDYPDKSKLEAVEGTGSCKGEVWLLTYTLRQKKKMIRSH